VLQVCHCDEAGHADEDDRRGLDGGFDLQVSSVSAATSVIRAAALKPWNLYGPDHATGIEILEGTGVALVAQSPRKGRQTIFSILMFQAGPNSPDIHRIR
jgi:hypothetical protein